MNFLNGEWRVSCTPSSFFYPIVKFSYGEKFTISVTKRPVTTTSPVHLSTCVQVYIFVLYLLYKIKEALTFHISSLNLLSEHRPKFSLKKFEQKSTSEVRTSVVSYEASISHLIAKRKFFHALIFGMLIGYSKGALLL